MSEQEGKNQLAVKLRGARARNGKRYQWEQALLASDSASTA
jgi:hypothetical protein